MSTHYSVPITITIQRSLLGNSVSEYNLWEWRVQSLAWLGSFESPWDVPVTVHRADIVWSDDAELAAMRRRMCDRCMQHCRDQGMTEAEALKVIDEAMNSPPRVPLATLACPWHPSDEPRRGDLASVQDGLLTADTHSLMQRCDLW